MSLRRLMKTAPPLDFVVKFTDESRKKITLTKGKNKMVEIPVFQDKEAIQGTLKMTPKRQIDHHGLLVELIGVVEFTNQTKQDTEILRVKQTLLEPGSMAEEVTVPFKIESEEISFETYNGANVGLHYYVRFSLYKTPTKSTPWSFSEEVAIHIPRPPPLSDPAIKDDVGVEDTVHIDFEYNKTKYHLDDVIMGKIFFILCRVQLRSVELMVVRRESYNVNNDVHNDTQTVLKYELVDGSPVRGETVPIRLFLKGRGLTPTYTNVNNKFSVRYFLILSMIDESEHRCYNQQEIFLYRRQ
ncbi:Vacuolar Protein Sorting 26 (VPS26) [Carpediemonas membranifera]|uniref:Vacuolar Protein Sorting 26 (VPS26) n=1 Tax=Carpediemonas membranifera TaxID=201153 RepID=A0A8J6B500_9EUKA|nr:Vacuolar Protein Sorting 26 (VPS26) [Carpediemonas membranifera]|eukprot:KAG9393134.1 Vacuolar Protein Sorting 26 (VPS26) [Carpediemonas membranifera]